MVSVLKDLLLSNDFRSLELEFRLGIYVNGKFHANIPKHRWSKIKDSMQGDSVEYTSIDRYICTNDPAVSTRFVSKSNGEEFWEHKHKISSTVCHEEGEFAIRTSIALEQRTRESFSHTTFVLQRKKVRTMFKFDDNWKVDFTKVEQIPNTNDIEETYEIEIELANNALFFEKEIELIIEEGRNIANRLSAY